MLMSKLGHVSDRAQMLPMFVDVKPLELLSLCYSDPSTPGFLLSCSVRGWRRRTSLKRWGTSDTVCFPALAGPGSERVRVILGWPSVPS